MTDYLKTNLENAFKYCDFDHYCALNWKRYLLSFNKTMANEDRNKRKCFAFIWKVENMNYWWSSVNFITSPRFTIDEISGTFWKLQLGFNFINKQMLSELYLEKQSEGNDEEVDLELALLASDGTVLHSFLQNNSIVGKDGFQIGSEEFPSTQEMFFRRRSTFLPKGTLTARCRIWKSEGEFSQNVQCFARTRIVVEKMSCLWKIENCNNLDSDDEKTYFIKSFSNGELLMTLQLCLIGGQVSDDTIRLKVIPNFDEIKTSILQISIVDAFQNTAKCFLVEFCICDEFENEEFLLICTKRELLEKKDTYIPNNTLSLMCEFTFSNGKIEEEIEFGTFDCRINGNPENEKTNDQTTPRCILMSDLKSMMNNSELSDVKLKTKNKTYPAHKLILSFRSPVFKAMFSNNMKENINDCVNIDDFGDETVIDMLRYIYSADVVDLEWGRAIQLYEAADKYQILNLKDVCSSYLKSNLGPDNACESLVLADLHHDLDLKRFVQDFIIREGEKIINSEEWGKLMESDLKLAAETMRLMFGRVLMK